MAPSSTSTSIGDSSTMSQIVSTLTAMGLFVTTAAVSQWIQNQHQHRIRRESESESNPPVHRRKRNTRSYSEQLDDHNEKEKSDHNNRDRIIRIQAEKNRLAFERRRLSRRLSFSYDELKLDLGGCGSEEEDESNRQRRRRTRSRNHTWDPSNNSNSNSHQQHRLKSQSEWSRSLHKSGSNSDTDADTDSDSDTDASLVNSSPIAIENLSCPCPNHHEHEHEHHHEHHHEQQDTPFRSVGRTIPRSSGNDSGNDNDAMTRNPRFRNGPSRGAIRDSRSSGANIRDRYHDFHPKYQNWRHFEHCNEHDRAMQRTRVQQRQQQQQQQEQQEEFESRPHDSQHRATEQHTQQQEAGEVPAQSRDDKPPTKPLESVTESTTTAPASTSGHRNPLHRSSVHVDNGSDQESVSLSLSTFAGDDDDHHPKKIDRQHRGEDGRPGGMVLDSGEDHFVWTTGGHASKYHRQLSSKSECLLVGATDDSESSSSSSFHSSPKPRVRVLNPTMVPSCPTSTPPNIDHRNTSNASNTNINDRNKDDLVGRMGRFERFCRMLSSSIVDDDSHARAPKPQTAREPPIRIASSSSLRDSSTATASSSYPSDHDHDHEHDRCYKNNVLLPADDGEEDIEDRHRALRTEYNAQIMPEKLVLIRHGQSLGNVDERVYATTPDNAMPITNLGWEQARKAGRILKDKILNPGESVHFMVSPYVRTVETFHGIVSAWCDPDGPEFASIHDHNRRVNAWYERLTELGLTWNEDPRIREQDFGNYQNPVATKRAKEERHRFGAFYYRFNNGESGSDVFDRVSTFLDSLWRSFETNKSQNYVLVTHGIVLRVLMARYFRYTIGQLNMLANPRNCEMVVLGHAGDGRLDLEGRCALELETYAENEANAKADANIDAGDGHGDSHGHGHNHNNRKQRVVGYRFHRRMRILPRSHIRTARFRISPGDVFVPAAAAAAK